MQLWEAVWEECILSLLGLLFFQRNSLIELLNCHSLLMPARQCTQPTSESVIYDLKIMYRSFQEISIPFPWMINKNSEGEGV